MSENRGKPKAAAPERDRAKNWLSAILKSGVQMPVESIHKLADESEFSWRTVRRASQDLHVKDVQKGTKHWWILP